MGLDLLVLVALTLWTAGGLYAARYSHYERSYNAVGPGMYRQDVVRIFGEPGAYNECSDEETSTQAGWQMFAIGPSARARFELVYSSPLTIEEWHLRFNHQGQLIAKGFQVSP